METIKERIVVHSAELFARKGCKTITMDDIATSMGISKRTIYENFTDKKELLEACLECFFEQQEEHIKVVLKSSDNIFDAMFKQFECNTKTVAQMKFDFFNEIRKYYPEVYNSTVKIYKEKHLKGTTDFLQKGQKDGVLRNDVETKIVAVLMHEINNVILTSELFKSYGLEPKQLLPVLMYNLIRGMCSEKGLRILENYVEKYKNNNN